MLGVGVILVGYVSYLLSECAAHYKSATYEDIALRAFGPRMQMFTAVTMILNQMSYLVAYTVLLKTLLPTTLEQLTQRSLPLFLSPNLVRG
jgi:amino acid permease